MILTIFRGKHYSIVSPQWLQNLASGSTWAWHFGHVILGFSTRAPQTMQNLASGGRSLLHATSIDHDHLVSAVGAKPSIYADGGMTLWTGDGLLLGSCICHRFLEDAREHHAQPCTHAEPQTF